MVDKTEYVIKDMTTQHVTEDLTVYDQNWLDILMTALSSLGLLSETMQVEMGPPLSKK